MRENKANRKILKRFMSGVMAMAVALSMCMVMTPIRALAAATDFWVYDGAVVTSLPTSPDYDKEVMSGEGLNVSDPTSVLSYSNNTLTIKSAITIATALGIYKDGQTIVVNGDCTINKMYISGASSITIKMNPGASLTITEFREYVTNPSSGAVLPLQKANQDGYLKILGGTVQDGKIVAGGELKVGDTSQESGKTTADSPTYKVTNTDEGKRSVTYEKPADNANGTEEVKAEVTLTDGNTYKVTAIDEGAFSNFKDKDKIKKIVVGDNVTEIGKNACKDLKNLTEVTFKDNLEIIGDSAFENTAITKVTLGKKVKKVGNRAYYNCGSLKKVTVKTAKLTKKGKVGKKAFGKTHKKMKVKMKMSKKDAKKAKAPTIKIFKSKRIGYVKTWSVK